MKLPVPLTDSGPLPLSILEIGKAVYKLIFWFVCHVLDVLKYTLQTNDFGCDATLTC